MKRTFVALLFVAAAAHAQHWQPSDRLRIANLNDPQISPDGKSAAVVISRANVKENRYDGDLLMIDVATGEQRQLTYDRRGVAAPRWSPDGSQLAFLANASSDREAKRQIWILPAHGGEARRITRVDASEVGEVSMHRLIVATRGRENMEARVAWKVAQTTRRAP